MNNFLPKKDINVNLFISYFNGDYDEHLLTLTKKNILSVKITQNLYPSNLISFGSFHHNTLHFITTSDILSLIPLCNNPRKLKVSPVLSLGDNDNTFQLGSFFVENVSVENGLFKFICHNLPYYLNVPYNPPSDIVGTSFNPYKPSLDGKSYVVPYTSYQKIFNNIVSQFSLNANSNYFSSLFENSIICTRLPSGITVANVLRDIAAAYGTSLYFDSQNSLTPRNFLQNSPISIPKKNCISLKYDPFERKLMNISAFVSVSDSISANSIPETHPDFLVSNYSYACVSTSQDAMNLALDYWKNQPLRFISLSTPAIPLIEPGSRISVEGFDGIVGQHIISLSPDNFISHISCASLKLELPDQSPSSYFSGDDFYLANKFKNLLD